MITVTDSAVDHLRGMLAERDGEADGLRLFIEKGGCSGLEYGMRFDRTTAGDAVVERDGVRVLVDPASLTLLRDVTLDYHDGLTGTGFRIVNPNAVRTCGCGTSFEPATAASLADAAR